MKVAAANDVALSQNTSDWLYLWTCIYLYHVACVCVRVSGNELPQTTTFDVCMCACETLKLCNDWEEQRHEACYVCAGTKPFRLVKCKHSMPLSGASVCDPIE
jgi:hypothetical protein